MDENFRDPMAILPLELQMVLKRKSSRDPSSRFTSKLHLLLTFVSQSNDSSLEEKIGCGWVSEDEFKLNKKAICEILGIKVNTLNVNLSNLNFKQLKHNKNGWTLWKRENFTRSSADSTAPDTSNLQPVKSINLTISNNIINPQYSGTVHLGFASRPELQIFAGNVMKIWYALTQKTDIKALAPCTELIKAAAERFKQEQQPLSNAIEVLQAIMNPTQSLTYISFTQLAKLLAMFGPEKTLMLKIASLLNCSNSTGQWLSFAHFHQPQNLYGFFRDDQPNCLQIIDSGRIIQVYNMPLIDANGFYVKTAEDVFRSWDDYFRKHPLISYQQDTDFS